MIDIFLEEYLRPDEEICEETLLELSNNKGEDEENE